MEFYIKSICAKGHDKTDSIVEFTPGLNIISGASDTGKTAVVRSIKFMFGGDKPFDKHQKGFDTIVMTLGTMKGDITLTRRIGSNIINVDSQVNGVINGAYDTEYKDKKPTGRPCISSFWFNLYGIPGDPMIMWRKIGERKHLTMKGVLRAFYLDENDIDRPESVLLPREHSVEPYFLSALLYFLTKDDFPEQKQYEEESISKARREAVEMFATRQFAEFKKKREQAESVLMRFSGMNVEAELQRTIERLEETEASLSDATNEQGRLIRELSELHAQEAELTLVLSRDEELHTQYQADVDRLTFNTEGERLLRQVPAPSKCPYCKSSISPIRRESFIESSKAELGRVILQMQGLAESEKEISEQLSAIRASIQEKKVKCDQLGRQIGDVLKPLAAKLREDIRLYQEYIEQKRRLEIFGEATKKVQETLDKPEFQAKKPTTLFLPKEHYPANFRFAMGKYAEEILKECKYRGLDLAIFDMGIFDLKVNGFTKGEEHGKGYNSYINTVLGLTMREYFIHHAEINPGFFIVDTPLHGYDEGPVTQQDSMVQALFECMLRRSEDGQIIVVENYNHLPTAIDFEGLGANVIEFTQGLYKSRFKNSRYGFLIGVTKK
mgnify:FL=1